MLEALGLSVLGSRVYQAMLDHADHSVARLAELCGASPPRSTTAWTNSRA